MFESGDEKLRLDGVIEFEIIRFSAMHYVMLITNSPGIRRSQVMKNRSANH